MDLGPPRETRYGEKAVTLALSTDWLRCLRACRVVAIFPALSIASSKGHCFNNRVHSND